MENDSGLLTTGNSDTVFVQGEKTVVVLSRQTNTVVRLACAHVKILKNASLMMANTFITVLLVVTFKVLRKNTCPSLKRLWSEKERMQNHLSLPVDEFM